MADASGTEVGAGATNRYQVSPTITDISRISGSEGKAQIAALPQSILFDPSRSALIIVDMQNDFCSPDGWIASLGVDVDYGRRLIAPINAASSAFRARAMPVIWVSWNVRPDRANLSPGTCHPFVFGGTQPGLGGEFCGPKGTHRVLTQGSWGAAILDELDQGEDDIHVAKHRISGFWDTPLDAILRTQDIKTLFFTGVNADHCVLGTLMDANFAGYDTILLEDCVGTTSPSFCMEATVHNVRFCFGFTAKSPDLVAALNV